MEQIQTQQMNKKVMYNTSGNIFAFFEYNKFAEDAKVIFIPGKWKEHYKTLPVDFKNKDNDEIFGIMNMDNPMANEKGQNFLKENKIRHTSMSVGDMIFDGKDYSVCLPTGWKRVHFMKDFEGF